jgi:hypothetical protein
MSLRPHVKKIRYVVAPPCEKYGAQRVAGTMIIGKAAGQGLLDQETCTRVMADVQKQLKLTEREQVTPEALRGIAAENGEYLEELTICLEYNDGNLELDVGSVLSELKFPAMKRLSLSCCAAKELKLWDTAYPSLMYVDLSNMMGEVNFDLNLPHLEGFSAEFTHAADGEMVAKSWSRCVSLDSINAYKMWGLSSGFVLASLPNCTSLCLYRSDDLQQLMIYAPKLEELNLQACYGLELLKIIDAPITPEQVTIL